MFERMFANVGKMPEPISIQEYISRQNQLYSTFEPSDVLILCSSPVTIHSNDVHHPYRTQSNLLYLTGWTEPESIMCATKASGTWKTHLFVQPKDTLKEIWEGRRPGVEGAMENWPIDLAYPHGELSVKLSKMLENCSRVFVKMGVDSDVDELIEKEMKTMSRAKQKLGTGPVSIVDPSSKINELRLRKSEAEIELMRHSAKVASQAHIQAMANTKPGVGEWQLEGIIEGFFKYCKTSGIAYPCIIGSGDNATVLHYNVNNDTCDEGEILLIDAGCEYKGYASDITRSWPVNGKFSEAQAEIYQVVLDSQLAAIDECRVGRPYDAPHEAARRVLAEGLISLGLTNQSLEAVSYTHLTLPTKA